MRFPRAWAAERGTPREVTIRVGGVAGDPSAPYGYVVTWSVEDLLEEYLRPARIVRDGTPCERPPSSEPDRVVIEGVGEMESFLSDGLRTLLETLPGVRDMAERTLRWPGHAAAVAPLVASGRFVEEIRSRCTTSPPRDLVVQRASPWNPSSPLCTMPKHDRPGTKFPLIHRPPRVRTLCRRVRE